MFRLCFVRCETDLDSLNTVDRQIRMEDPSVAAYTNTSYQQAVQQQQQQFYQQQQYHYEDNNTMPVDINEADERMKRYYGIVPKHSAAAPSIDKDKAEIRTVRIVKRESEKRQRDKSKSRYDDSSFSMDELAEEDQANCATANTAASTSANGFYPEDPIMDDPVLSQFSHVLTLPRRNNKRDEAKEKRPLSQRNSIALHETQSDSRSFGPDQWRGSLRPRRNLSSVSCPYFIFISRPGHCMVSLFCPTGVTHPPPYTHNIHIR